MYRAPLAEISQTLNQVADLPELLKTELFSELSPDIVEAILQEAAKFSETRITPLRTKGDHQGATLKDAKVTTAEGWKELYKDWTDGGWNALTGDPAYGGQGLPTLLSVAVAEMWNSGSLGFAIASTLTMGAVEALEHHASDELKKTYLEKLISGEWSGTMNLTEPQAGSDLGALRCRAERANDGTYRIFGQKIFITYGEHDLTDNIVHLVLARLPDAPAGTKGISLFLVPKYLVNEDGSLGARNDVFCAGLEEKLGLHASPTCTMIYGDGFGDTGDKGAVGYLIGEEHKGLVYMFTMMNNARLLVGIQGVAIAEAAYQKARAYALDRRQGRSLNAPKGAEMSPIIEHPDVQRMLLTMKGLTQASRAICYSCAQALDMAKADSTKADFWANRASLLTPLAKAFSTDSGVDVASLGIQVHGGMGYIEETGAAQLLRDARILPIYEGTNGIQAIDLVMRKLPLENGGHIHGFLQELRDIAEQAKTSATLKAIAPQLEAALDTTEEATRFLQDCLVKGDNQTALCGATAYQRLLSLTVGALYLTKAGLHDDNSAALATFFAQNTLQETAGLKQSILSGAASLTNATKLLQDI
ncbi:acyl-CoA dehydrogenase [Pseudochrobactrum sp. sp1633]|uniref:acyl-CoA dehydrogenase n=1 Tax=Pseudochrobactrum sp. sp1633 TaxID=3036706 RepID=UPI0025A536C9|nr:acyl-CoA dehydrogenase [Pseudochrobactrum sp. sp1633]MDM8345296.1 acyl-CoA dehydrogenase [Pseudochrobactrum sp. sp1633]HWD12853.1 acyl-CoA dehydrogenase [Pseudochrobactrum sp.]